uniref:Uncharacterized protein n=1 Tax=Rangifer tarandus platyrhynchus TaxID=3082113 RepID=A0ACB0E4K0_RANTA|nr:unnamed protein product [Rangifer tarandus platyrhynchus]
MRVAPWSPPLGGLARQGLPPGCLLPSLAPASLSIRLPWACGERYWPPEFAVRRGALEGPPTPSRTFPGDGCPLELGAQPARQWEARSTPCSNGTTRRPRYPGAQRPLGSRDRNGSARAPPHVARATHPHPFLPAGPARRVARDAAGRPTPGMLRARGGALRGGAKLAAPGVPRAAGRG